MTDVDRFDRLLGDALREYAMEAPIEVESAGYARAIALAHPRHGGFLPSISLPRRLVWLAAAALIVLAALAAALLVGQRQSPLGAGLLAFSRDGDVYIASADGSRAVPAIRHDRRFSVLAWAPDGRWLAVEADDEVYRLDPVTLDLQRLPIHVQHFEFGGVSPDGRSILTRGRGDDCCVLAIIDVETGAAQGIGPDGSVCLPVWSPDGRWIAAVTPGAMTPAGQVAGRPRVIVIDATSGAWTDVADWGGYGCGWSTGWDAPTWSPDSERLAFVGVGAISVVDRDGTDSLDIVSPVVEWPRPRWSPDGTWIAYRGADGLGLIRPDGTEQRLLVPGQVDKQWIEWSADGTRLDFTRVGPDGFAASPGLWTVVVATGATQRIDAADADIEGFARQAVPLDRPSPGLPNGARVAPERISELPTPAPAPTVEPAGVAKGLAFDTEEPCESVVFDFGSGSSSVVREGCAAVPRLWSPDGTAYVAFSNALAASARVLRLDGSPPVDLEAAGSIIDAVWSPSGEWLALTVCPAGPNRAGGAVAPYACDGTGQPTSRYVLVRPDGSDRLELPGEPSWSPDSQDLSVASVDGTLLMGSAGGRDLVPIGTFPRVEAWAPDGQRFGYLRGGDVWIANVDGSGARNVTGFGVAAGVTAAGWSPDGTSIAAIQGDALWLIAVDVTDRRRFEVAGRTPRSLTWSPDGRHLAIRVDGHAAGVSEGLILVPVADWQATLLADADVPVWSPDGSLLAVQSGRDGRFAIHIVHPDGSGPYPIETKGPVAGPHRWIP